jgi:hypothetical protein
MYTALGQDTGSLSKPNANLSCFQKNAYYARIKISTNLPSDLRSLVDEEA